MVSSLTSGMHSQVTGLSVTLLTLRLSGSWGVDLGGGGREGEDKGGGGAKINPLHLPTSSWGRGCGVLENGCVCCFPSYPCVVWGSVSLPQTSGFFISNRETISPVSQFQ